MNRLSDTRNLDASRKVQPSLSYWTASVHHPEFSSLTRDLKADVVIVGGGMAGLSVAYNLGKEGKECIVLESGLIGGGETRHSSAHLTHALDSRYFTLEKMFGEHNTRLIAQSHTVAINQIERIVRREKINCDFMRVSGYLILHPSDSVKSLQREFEATHRVGLNTELVTSVPDIRIREKIALKFPQQAQFHPIKYLHGLSTAIVNQGGKIYTNTKVTSIEDTAVTAEHFRISADHIVIATNVPFNNRFTVLAKQITYRSYIVALTVHKGLISPALWWDTGRQYSIEGIAPYHYARIQPFDEEYDLLICGGQDHLEGEDANDKEEESERFARLESWVCEHFPLARDVVYRWSGLITEPVDQLGYIGRNPGDENIYLITGDAGNGLTYGAIAGNLIPDLIDGRENPWKDSYSPSRHPAYGSDYPRDKKRNFSGQHRYTCSLKQRNKYAR